MSKFVAVLQNRSEGELSKELLNQHVEHLKKLTAEEKIYLCGPYKTSKSAIQIIEASSYGDAEVIIKSDPFIKNDYYKSYTLDELVEANSSNNWLLSTTNEKIEKRENKN
ncbi:MAG: hypothetical protein GY714_21425 [Desulfobacterales bacterium]|nr:hypothetical protein [Desulfobacterales bacterium]